MASYNRIRASKQSPIGTIMPWGGSSSNSKLNEDAIPQGWLVCRGQTLLARDYPLLAQLLGNTYGPFQEPGGPPVGIQNSYPNYDENDLFTLPNLNNTGMVDLEGSRLPPETQLVVGQYITENGADATSPNIALSYIDVNFSIESDSALSGKITRITIEDPAYFTTGRIIPRKLGIDHTPGHSHPQPQDADSKYPSAILGGGYVGLFEAGNFDVQDSEYTTVSAEAVNPSESGADRFNPGTALVTWYDEASFTLPTMNQFRDFTAAPANVPAIPGSARAVSGYGNTVDYEDPNTCIINVQSPAVSSPFPPSGLYQGFKNFYSAGTVAPSRGGSTLKPYPTTLNHNADAWNSESLASHNHFTIDLAMTRGQMRIPGTILINNMTTGTIAPVSVDKALSVQINANTPSVTTLIIMRAY